MAGTSGQKKKEKGEAPSSTAESLRICRPGTSSAVNQSVLASVNSFNSLMTKVRKQKWRDKGK